MPTTQEQRECIEKKRLEALAKGRQRATGQPQNNEANGAAAWSQVQVGGGSLGAVAEHKQVQLVDVDDDDMSNGGNDRQSEYGKWVLKMLVTSVGTTRCLACHKPLRRSHKH